MKSAVCTDYYCADSHKHLQEFSPKRFCSFSFNVRASLEHKVQFYYCIEIPPWLQKHSNGMEMLGGAQQLVWTWIQATEQKDETETNTMSLQIVRCVDKWPVTSLRYIDCISSPELLSYIEMGGQQPSWDSWFPWTGISFGLLPLHGQPTPLACPDTPTSTPGPGT